MNGTVVVLYSGGASKKYVCKTANSASTQPLKASKMEVGEGAREK